MDILKDIFMQYEVDLFISNMFKIYLNLAVLIMCQAPLQWNYNLQVVTWSRHLKLLTIVIGAFLIPFILMLITMGLPIFYLELCLGQYVARGPIKAFSRMAPAFHGVGYSTLVVMALVLIYYMVIVAWTLFFMFASFSPNLAWASCKNDFNTISK